MKKQIAYGILMTGVCCVVIALSGCASLIPKNGSYRFNDVDSVYLTDPNHVTIIGKLEGEPVTHAYVFAFEEWPENREVITYQSMASDCQVLITCTEWQPRETVGLHRLDLYRTNEYKIASGMQPPAEILAKYPVRHVP